MLSGNGASTPSVCHPGFAIPVAAASAIDAIDAIDAGFTPCAFSRLRLR